jgi:hypothetical protein
MPSQALAGSETHDFISRPKFDFYLAEMSEPSQRS